MKTNKPYFKGLNELRAIAALLVIFHHIELYKYENKIPTLLNIEQLYYVVNNIGRNAVKLFFIISGFLITTILLEEKEKNNTINLKKFYIRRALRIWPLYFLVITFAFFVYPFLISKLSQINFLNFYEQKINLKNYDFKSRLMHFTFLSNLALIWYNKYVAAATQTWSVSVEEQFYIIWPLFIMFFNKKTMIFLLFLFILFYYLIFYSSNDILMMIKYVFMFQNIFWGALGVYLLKIYPNAIKKVSSSVPLYIVTLLITTSLIFSQIFSVNIQNNLVSVLFLLILLFTINDNNKFSYRNGIISKIGIISYGIYMYHPLMMYIVFPVANKFLIGNLIVYNFAIYSLIFSITIVLSHFSYKYFESYFLRLKDKKFNTQ